MTAPVSRRYVALYTGRDAYRACTAVIKALPGIVVVDSQPHVFVIEATASAIRPIKALPDWTVGVSQVLFESPSPLPPGLQPRRTVATASAGPARITARTTTTSPSRKGA